MTLDNVFNNFVFPRFAKTSGDLAIIERSGNCPKTRPNPPHPTHFQDNFVLVWVHDKLAFEVTKTKWNGPSAHHLGQIMLLPVDFAEASDGQTTRFQTFGNSGFFKASLL